MLTSILAVINSFGSGLLSGLGLHSLAGAATTATAATTASVGETVVAGAGFLIFSKILGKIVSKVINFLMVFIIGMLIYRHVPVFKDMIDNLCDFIDIYLPTLIADLKTMVQ